ncbi:MAG: protein-L-isoaspartate(D-aspartate) O-methyltransferase [Candidatus Micrarchaeota archaeon]|nr:protein-L-isoaspartate(D-aspartate) O-methyltransferase [Candidatus Micrarchaeota archaeon]
MENIERNKIMIEYLIKSGYIDKRIGSVMEEIKREEFVDDSLKEYSYIDTPLPIGFGQTISAPSIVGLMMKELDIKEGMKILEIGTGSGWQTAMLCKLVGENGKVFSVERIKELAEMAKERLVKLGIKNVEIKVGDGTIGWIENAPYDRIIVGAAAPDVPKPLIEQLNIKGKLIIPVGHLYWQELVLVEKGEKEIKVKNLLPVMFVPLVGRYGYSENEKL